MKKAQNNNVPTNIVVTLPLQKPFQLPYAPLVRQGAPACFRQFHLVERIDDQFDQGQDLIFKFPETFGDWNSKLIKDMCIIVV